MPTNADGNAVRLKGDETTDDVQSVKTRKRLVSNFFLQYRDFLSNVEKAADKARELLETIVEQGDLKSLEKIFEYLHNKGETIDKIYTGKVNLLHIATTFGYDEQGEKILRLIAEKCPELLKERLAKKQPCLHIAVSQQNVKVATIILQEMTKQRDMSASDVINDCLAISEDIKVYDTESRHYKEAEVGFPLAIAAWNTDRGMIDVLVNYGAKLDQQTLYSQNTVFHILVQAASHPSAREDDDRIAAIKETFSYLIKKAEAASKRSSFKQRMADVFRTLNLRNAKGDIPLIMAARLANQQMFEHIHNVFFCYRHLQTTDGTSDTFTYDITEVDGALSENKNLSALEAFANSPNVGETEDVFKFVNSKPIKQLIAEKWSEYRWVFWSWAVCHFIVMALLTASAVLRPVSSRDDSNGTLITDFSGVYSNWNEPWPLLQTVTDLLSMSYFVILTIFEVFSTITRTEQKKKNKLVSRTAAAVLRCKIFPFGIYTIKGLVLDRWILWGFLSSHAVGFICRFTDYLSEEIFAVLHLLLGWIFVLFFFKAVRQLSYFIKVIRVAILEDFVKVLIIYVIFIFACTSSLSVALKSSSDAPNDYAELVNQFQLLVLISIGLGDAEALGPTRAPFLGILVLLIFIIASYIVFMNVYIGLLSETTNRLSQNKKEEWDLSRLQIILYIESLMFFSLSKFKVKCGEPGNKKLSYSMGNPDAGEDKLASRIFFQVKSVVPSKTLPATSTQTATTREVESQTRNWFYSSDGKKRWDPGTLVYENEDLLGFTSDTILSQDDFPVRGGTKKPAPSRKNKVKPLPRQQSTSKKDEYYMETSEVQGNSNST